MSKKKSLLNDIEDIDEIYEDLSAMWRFYVLERDENLTLGAEKLKYKLIDFVEKVKNLEVQENM